MRIILATVAATFLFGACNKFEKTESGVEYRIVEQDESTREVKSGDMLLIHMVGKTQSNDSSIFDSYKSNKPFYIPADEPTLKEVFMMLHKGDSAMFKVNADSLYQKSFQQARPAGIKEGEILTFNVRVLDIYNQQELQQEIERKNQEFAVKDSIDLNNTLSNLKDAQKTSGGITYVVKQQGKGKGVKKGDKVTVSYRGQLLDGFVFDETKPEKPDFTFTVGMGQVIQGWDEILTYMKEGDEFEVYIPWQMAYGPRGTGPIPPYSSLNFNIKLIKVN